LQIPGRGGVNNFEMIWRALGGEHFEISKGKRGVKMFMPPPPPFLPW